MVLLTLLARVSDGLPLSASMEDEQVESHLAEYKLQAKNIFKTLSYQSETRRAIESGPFIFYLFIEFNVAYLCLCEKAYPKKLAFAYLEEIQNEFHTQHGSEVMTASRPYQFIKFDTFIQKTKRAYKDTRSQKKNLEKFNEELHGITEIMVTNIQDVLDRGGRLDKMSEISSNLSMESRKYARDAKNLNLQLFYRQYGPPAIVVLVILLVLYIRIWWF